MRRRDFIEFTAGALAAGALGRRESREMGGVASFGPSLSAPMTAAAFHAGRRHVRTRFGDIAYVERGTGDAALFLHGFPLNGFQWRCVIERLSSHWRCVAPDFMGLGYTKVNVGQDVAPAAQVEMLAAFLNGLSITDVDIVANDSGGAVAQLFLARYPQRVRTLLLTNCDTEIDCPPPALIPVIELAREGRFVAEWLAPWLSDTALARSPEGLGGLTYTDPANLSDEAIRTYLSPLVRSPAWTDAYAAALAPNVLEGVEQKLRESRVPARIVWGTGDTIFSPDSPGYLDRTFGNSLGVRYVEGAKLFYPEEYPDIIADEARRLWGV